MTTYAEFRLRIEHGPTPGTFRIEASGLGGEQQGSFVVPFSDTELENFILRIGRTRRGVRRIESPEMDLARSFGSKLFSAVMRDKIGELYRSAMTEARAEREGLRITLSLTDVPELGAIPWEYLYDPPDFLAVSSWTPVVRYLDLPRPRRVLDVELPLRILAVVSAPSDAERLDAALERDKLEAALRPLLDANAVTIDWLEKPSLLALAKQLRPDAYHILHFIGHGGFDERSEEGALLFEDDLGRGRLVSGDQLGTILRDKLNLRLVLLNSCEGARNSSKDPFSGVATSLVERDIPAVIGMQFEITDRAAILFASEFYAMLAEGQPVDQAIAEARLAIFADQNDVEWGTPVLFMRVTDGRLFKVADAGSLPRISPADVTAIENQVAAGAGAVAGQAPPSGTAGQAPPSAPAAPTRPVDPTPPTPLVEAPAAPTVIDGPPIGTWPTGATPFEPVTADAGPGAAAADDGPPVGAAPVGGTLGAAGEAGLAAPPRGPGVTGASITGPAGTAVELRNPAKPGRIEVMRPRTRIAAAVVAVVAVLAIAVAFLVLTASPAEATIRLVGPPDPGAERVTVEGSGFRAGEMVTFEIGGHRAGAARADEAGLAQIDILLAEWEPASLIAEGYRSHVIGILERDVLFGGGEPSESPGEATETPPGGPTETPGETPLATPTGTPGEAFVSPSAAMCPAGDNGGIAARILGPQAIVFYSDHSDLDNGKDRELYVVDPSTRELCQLTSNDVDDEFPTWSTDHTQIAYTSSDADGRHIFIWNANGPPSRLTAGIDDFFPAWSKDDQIAFVRRDGRTSQIWRIGSDGSDEQLVTEQTTARAPAWSTDGSVIAFMAQFDRADFDLAAVKPDGSELQRLDRPGTSELNPALWVDGAVVFVMDRGEKGSNDNEIRTATSSDTISDPLTNNDVQDGNPVWSPEGNRIAFYRADGKGFDLFTMNPDGSDEQPLVIRGGQNLDPNWR